MTKRTRSRLRRVAVFVLATVLVLALISWRLASAAVSLGWVESRIEGALNSELTPLALDLERGSFRWLGFERPVAVRFAKVRIFDGSASELVVLTDLSVGLSPGDLLHGEVSPTRLEIERLRVSVTRKVDGSLAIGPGGGKQEAGGEAPKLLELFLAPPRPGSPLGRLTSIGIRGADVEIEDRRLGIGWGARDADLEIERSGTGLEASLDFEPAVQRPLGRMTLEGEHAFEEGGARVRIEFESLDVAAFSALSPSLEPLEVLDGPVRGHLEAVFSRGFEPREMRFDLRSDPVGVSGVADLTAGLRSPSVTLRLVGLEPWRFAGGIEALAPLEDIRVRLDGDLRMVVEQGILKSAEVDLEGEPGEIRWPGVHDRPLALGPSKIRGSIENGLERIQVKELRTSLGSSVVAISIEAERTDAGYDGDLQARVDSLPVESLAVYWPADAAAAARSWVVEHIPAGQIRALGLDLAFALTLESDRRRLAVRDLEGSFAFDDLSVEALAPQPPVTGLAGRGRITGESLDFEIDSGRLGEIEIADARVSIGDFDGDRIDLTIQVDCVTPVAAAIDLISNEPLTLIEPAVIAAEDVSGSAKANLRLLVPLAGEGDGRGIEVSADASVKAFGWRKAPLGLELDEGDFELAYQASSVRIHGQVAALGVPTAVDYRADLGDSAQTLDARARLTKDDRDRLGIPDQPVISGPVTARVRYSLRSDDSTSIAAEIDLEESEIDLPLFAWRKPAGAPGTARLEASPEGSEGWSLSEIRVAAGDLTVDGRAELRLDPTRLGSLTVERFDFGKNRLRGGLERDGDDRFEVAIRGDYLELENVVRELMKGPRRASGRAAVPSEAPFVGLNLELGEVASGGKVVLEHLSGRAELEGGRVQTLDLSADTGNGHRLEAHLGAAGGSRRGRLQAGAAGDLMKTLGVTSLFHGGDLTMEVERAAPDSAVRVHLDITELGLDESAVLGEILRLATLEGLLATLEGEGFDFAVVHLDLELEDGTIRLDEGHAYGQGITITLSGSVDLGGEEWNLRGVVAHTGVVQRAIGEIAGLGKVLPGRRRSGLLGTEFAVSGPLSQPDVKVHPLSTFTPGILRGLFSLKEPHGRD